MKLNENKKMTKSVLQAARQRREEMFKGMSDVDIMDYVPNNKAYLYEFSNKFDIGIFIPDCVICGGIHKHGKSVHDGTRVTMCKLKGFVGKDEVIPLNYRIDIYWNDRDNVQLAKKYGLMKG